MVAADLAVGRRIYLEAMPACTQTHLASLTEHDRSDISNWVRGVRNGRVGDIEVLNRIADGLRMPDEARVLLGLAPADALVTTIRDARPMPRGFGWRRRRLRPGPRRHRPGAAGDLRQPHA